jgi:hypothetical protein
MQTALFHNNKRFSEKEFSKEKELEDLMFINGKCLFSQSSILIEAKKKIDNKALGGTLSFSACLLNTKPLCSLFG